MFMQSSRYFLVNTETEFPRYRSLEETDRYLFSEEPNFYKNWSTEPKYRMPRVNYFYRWIQIFLERWGLIMAITINLFLEVDLLECLSLLIVGL